MTWSLNEIEALARKAARGGGMAWGLAEEAGKATRWLCAAGWPGATALADLLLTNDGAAWEAIRPRTDTDTWTARDGILCPTAAGAALTDRAADLAAGHTIRLQNVSRPILLIPHAAWAAETTGTALDIRWPGLRVTCRPGACYAEITRIGTTSISVRIETWVRRRLDDAEERVTEGTFVYVAIDEGGKPRPVPRG